MIDPWIWSQLTRKERMLCYVFLIPASWVVNAVYVPYRVLKRGWSRWAK